MDARDLKALAGLRFDAVPTERTLWGGRLAHIEGFNQDVYDRMFREITALGSDRPDPPPGLVVHGEFGSGKSHLLWWARRLIAGSGTGGYYFNIQPDGTSETLWTRTVGSILHGLQEPVGHDDSGRAVTQLSLFLKRLGACLDLPEAARRVLGGFEAAGPDRIRGHLRELNDRLRNRYPGLEARNVARALALMSVLDDDANVAGETFLRASNDERDTRVDWGLRPPEPGHPREVVGHLSSLLAMTGPSLFVVDQIDDLVTASTHSTETSGLDVGDTDLAAALMTIREKLSRSLTVISCLDHTWQTIRERAVRSALDRFPVALELKPIPSSQVGQRLIARFLRDQYQDLGFQPEYPTWPIPEASFASVKGVRPRRLIQLVGDYVRACTAAGQLLPPPDLGNPVGQAALVPVIDDPTKKTQGRYADHRRSVHIDGLKETGAEQRLGTVLVAAVRALIVELGAGAGAGAGAEFRVADAARGAELSSVHCEIWDAVGRRVCLRGVNAARADAIERRLDRAREFAHGDPDTDAHLVVVRTHTWRDNDRLRNARAGLIESGGTLATTGDDELRTLQAVALTTSDDTDETRQWLRRHQPVSGTGLGRTLISLLYPETAESGAEPVFDPPGVKRQTADEPKAVAEPDTTGRPGLTTGCAVEASMDAPDSVLPLGRTKNGELVTVPMETLRKHIAVFASSGSGKTVLLRRIIEECALRGVSTIVLDPNNDLARLGDPWPEPPDGWWPGDTARADDYLTNTDVVVWTPGVSKGNPLTLQPFPDFTAVRDDPDELRLAVDTAVASLAPRARIDAENHQSDGRRAVLRETLLEFARHGGGDLEQLIAFLADPPEQALTLPSAVKHANYVASALSYARSNDALFDGDGTAFDPDRLLTPAGGFRARVSVINLAGVPEEARPAFINRLQMTLFSWIKRHPAKDKPLSGLFIMDEAQTFIPSGRNTPCTESTRNLASQARKYGLGLVYATQAPRGIDSRITGNAASHFYGRVTVPAHVGAVNEMARAKGEKPPPISRLLAGSFYASLDGLPLSELAVPMCLSKHGSPLEEPEIIARAREGRP